MVVRFLLNWQIYRAGEVAGFSDKTAQKLIESGIAVHVPAELEVAPALQTVADSEVHTRDMKIVVTAEGKIDNMPPSHKRWSRRS